MKVDGITFRCEPCKQIIAFYRVSGTGPYTPIDTAKPESSGIGNGQRD